jgi:hypothetical protein
MPEVTRESLLRSSKCIGSQKDNYIINSSICIIGDIGNTRSDAAIFGDSHSIAILPVFDKIGKVYSKNYVHIGVGGCPPLLGVYVKGNNNIDFCNEISQSQFSYVMNNNIKVYLKMIFSLNFNQ